MSIVIQVLAAIFAIFIVILIHELGHFIAARSMGVRVIRFSVGFGRSIWSYTSKSGTEYAINILPLGGYVKMLGEEDEIVEPDMKSQSYSKKVVWKRMIISAAGPIANFILALVLFWIVFMGGVTHVKPVVGHVVPDSIVGIAGLHGGDQFISIDGELSQDWQRVMMLLVAKAGQGNVVVKLKEKNKKQLKVINLNLSEWGLYKRKPNILKSLGFTPYMPKVEAVVERVRIGSPAAKSGIAHGDTIIKVGASSVTSWRQLVNIIKRHPHKKLKLTLLRHNKQLTIDCLIGARELEGERIGYLGVEPRMPEWPQSMQFQHNYSAFSAWMPATKALWRLMKFNVVVIGKMFEGDVSLSTLGGPISIFQTAGQASAAGWSAFIGFVAFVSVALGFVNLLPIPVLDGGHLLFQFIELVFRRPIPAHFQLFLLKLGLVFLLMLMLLVTFNDVARLIPDGVFQSFELLKSEAGRFLSKM